MIPQLARVDRLSPDQLSQIYVTGSQGKLVPLSTFATLRTTTEPRDLKKFQQLNAVRIQGVIPPPVPLDKALTFLENEARAILPQGFAIDSFAPSPGWKRVLEQTGSGEEAVITKVTWSGGKVPTEEDALFQFLAQAASSKTYTFQVEQTYSDGTIVNWSGPESSDAPAPTISAKSSLGGGGTSTLTIVALAVGALGLLVGGAALLAGGGSKRALA